MSGIFKASRVFLKAFLKAGKVFKRPVAAAIWYTFLVNIKEKKEHTLLYVIPKILLSLALCQDVVIRKTSDFLLFCTGKGSNVTQ